MPVAKLRTNPVGPAFDEMADDDNLRFQITHDGVGPHLKGEIVGARAFGPGADLARLYELGAIRRLSIEETETYWEEHPRPVADDPADGDGPDETTPPPLKGARATRRRNATRPIEARDPREGVAPGEGIPALNDTDKEVADPTGPTE